MYKGRVINVLQHGNNFMIAGKYPVLDMNVNEVTDFGAVKAPESAVAAYPTIERVVFDGDAGWLRCSSEAGWLDEKAFKHLAAVTMVQKLQDEKYLIHTEEDMLPSSVYTDPEIVEIMSADIVKLYEWMRHILSMPHDAIDARTWLSDEINKFLPPAPLPANPVEDDTTNK